MKRLFVLTIACATTAILATTALAKGPSAASVEGPGLKGSVVVTGGGEPGNSSPLGQLVASGGFMPSVFGQTPDPMKASQPAGELGPRYKVTFTVPGPNGSESTIVQDVYPYATPYPLTHMRPGQKVWDGQETYGGWFVSDRSLRNALVAAGLPTSAPADGFEWSMPATALSGLVAVAAVAGILLLIRRRLRSQPDRRAQIV